MLIILTFLSGIVVPVHLARPFVIGVFHGKKPKPDDLLEDFMLELSRLSPDVAGGNRKCVVSIHCCICDSPMKASISGNYNQLLQFSVSDAQYLHAVSI